MGETIWATASCMALRLPTKVSNCPFRLLADVFPEFVRIGFDQIVLVNEIHPGFQFVDGWHEILGLKAGKVADFHADHVIGALLWLVPCR